MNKIKMILENTNRSISDFIECFEEVKKNGDVAIIKFDGERLKSGYTVIITFPDNDMKREIIRVDEGSLEKALLNALTRYVE